MRRHHFQAAFSLVELLVVIAIIGVLVGMLMPAVQKVRGAADRLRCSDNLRQQGIALHAYHSDFACFPPAQGNPKTYIYHAGEPGFFGDSDHTIYNHSGFTLLLPYLEQGAIHAQYDYRKESSAPGNDEVIMTYVQFYHCPADAMPEVDVVSSPYPYRARRSNYLMCVYHYWNSVAVVTPAQASLIPLYFGGPQFNNRGAFEVNRGCPVTSILDGTSNTIAIGETKQERSPFAMGSPSFKETHRVHWGTAHTGANTGAMVWFGNMNPGLAHINCPIGSWWDTVMIGGESIPTSDHRYFLQHDFGFGSWHQGGANFVFCDGSVRFLPNSMPFPVFEEMGSRNSGRGLQDSTY